MDDSQKLSDLTVGQYKILGKEIAEDISVNHLLKAADDLFWKNARQLGVEVTGKDITKVHDVLCIRKTFDESQKCRIKKEKQDDAFLTETTKRRVNLFFLVAALACSMIALFKQAV